MGTRSMIGVEENGIITAVYCHFDGYLDHNGEILSIYYRSRDRIQELLDLGDMSSLDKTVDKCEFYGRDRGEDDTGCRTYTSRSEMIEKQWDCEYFYLWVDNDWIYSTGKNWANLQNELESIEAERAA